MQDICKIYARYMHSIQKIPAVHIDKQARAASRACSYRRWPPLVRVWDRSRVAGLALWRGAGAGKASAAKARLSSAAWGPKAPTPRPQLPGSRGGGNVPVTGRAAELGDRRLVVLGLLAWVLDSLCKRDPRGAAALLSPDFSSSASPI